MSASASRRQPPSGAMSRLTPGLAGALALALVWSLLWGGWHRALHGGVPPHPAQDVPAWSAMQASVPGVAGAAPGTARAVSPVAAGHDASGHDAFGHQAGSDDCRLLDQASLADALATALPVVLPPLPAPGTTLAVERQRIAAIDPPAYQARAPPRG